MYHLVHPNPRFASRTHQDRTTDNDLSADRAEINQKSVLVNNMMNSHKASPRGNPDHKELPYFFLFFFVPLWLCVRFSFYYVLDQYRLTKNL